MSKIKNTPNQVDEIVEAVRSAIEFRGTWFALLFDEMRKAGVDAEGIIMLMRFFEAMGIPQSPAAAEKSTASERLPPSKAAI